MGLIGPVLDHADEEMGFRVRTTDPKPLYRDHARPPDGVIDRIDDGIELLILGQQLLIASLDQIGGSRAVFPMISARGMPIIFSAARLTKT